MWKMFCSLAVIFTCFAVGLAMLVAGAVFFLSGDANDVRGGLLIFVPGGALLIAAAGIKFMDEIDL